MPLLPLLHRWFRPRSSRPVPPAEGRADGFNGTDEQWFEQDLARLDETVPGWDRQARVMDARRWCRKGADLNLLRAIFGHDVATEALALEGTHAVPVTSAPASDRSSTSRS